MIEKILYTIFIAALVLFICLKNKIKNQKIVLIMKIVLIVSSILYTVYLFSI